MVLGAICTGSCISGTYNNNGICTGKNDIFFETYCLIACTALDNYCITCSVSGSCLGCSGGKVAYGASCYDSCPFGTKNSNGICVGKSTSW